MAKTAILVDGGFYRKRALKYWGPKSPQDRAHELQEYVFRHLDKLDGTNERELYRVFYYDCPPSQAVVYHPLKGNINLGKEPAYKWSLEFLDALKKQRKVALRLGRLASSHNDFHLTQDATRKLCSGKMTVDDLTDRDFVPGFKQKGVDMRIGVDVSSLAYEGIVNQIVLIAGDSDFVPAAKAARRKGIDFILDAMGNNISDDLAEHIDGLETFVNEGDPTAKPTKKGKQSVRRPKK